MLPCLLYQFTARPVVVWTLLWIMMTCAIVLVAFNLAA